MPYATQQDLVDRFGEEELVQLTDRQVPPAGTVDGTVIGKALADADALIDGYLAARYAIPITPSPPLLVKLAADVARYFLHGKSATETVRQAYEDALKVLQEIARGLAVVPGASTPAGPSPSGAPAVLAPERRLGPETLSGFLAQC